MLIYIIDVTDGFEKGIVRVIVTLLQQRTQKTFWSDFMIIRKLIRSLYDPEQIFVINLPNCSALSDALLPPATKLGQGYVFTGVCDSVHKGGVSASVHTGIPHHPGSRHHPRADPPGSRHPLEQTPPPGSRHPPKQTAPRSRPPTTEHAGRYSKCVGGMHPTRMQSCYHLQTKFAKVMFLQVSVCPQGEGGMRGWQGGACVVAKGACMVVGGGGACVVARGRLRGCRGHVWLQWGTCMVVGGVCGCGGHAWLQGGMHGCRGHVWLLGACMVVGGHAWLLGGVHGCRVVYVGYDEIRSMSERYASYWNAFLYCYRSKSSKSSF